MSWSGMMPPTMTSTSSSFSFFMSSMMRGQSVMCAPESTDKPDDVHILLQCCSHDLLGRLPQSRVDRLRSPHRETRVR